MKKIKQYFDMNRGGIILAMVFFCISLMGRYLFRDVFDLLRNPDSDQYIVLARNLIKYHIFLWVYNNALIK